MKNQSIILVNFRGLQRLLQNQKRYTIKELLLTTALIGFAVISNISLSNAQTVDAYGIESASMNSSPVNDTVVAGHASIVPVIDGIGDDSCWDSTRWNNIDQTWITWGEEIDSTDFFGRFKVSWSKDENLLYYLVEITDDAFVDGYVYPNEGYPNFDIVEIFIDEDKSGGLHVFDFSDSWGENSENAFSYHIAINAPEDGKTENSFVVCDIDGTGWSDKIITDYANHFPELTMKKNSNQYIYEFSMAVYDDTYYHGNSADSRVSLTADKLMGMSVAYCDNDTPGTDRDNFFGSVWVPEEAHNDHWKNANGFGSLRLNASGLSINKAVQAVGTINDYEIAELHTSYKVHDDISTLFSDPDQDTLEYTHHADTSVLEVSIAENAIYVEAISTFVGSQTITITATDDEFEASHQFNVSIKSTLVEPNHSLLRNIHCFPNPFTSAINVQVTTIQQLSEHINLTLYDVSGKQVFCKKHKLMSPSKNIIPLNVSEIPSGIYILKVSYKTGISKMMRMVK